MAQLPPDQPDRLILDVTPDLERVDSVMTRVVTDPVMVDEFIRDPSGVLTRLGLHPRTTREIHDRVNRVFYAVLTNRELIELLSQHYSDGFSPSTDSTNAAMTEALEAGELSNALDYDIAGVEHLFGNADVLRSAFLLTLNDLNNRRILVNVYSTEEIEQYVDALVQAIQERQPLRDFPVLEEWDENYGIGKGQGDLVLEVGPGVTLGVAVEVGVLVTLALEVNVVADVIKPAQQRAILSDPGAARSLATVGALLRFSGELMVHVNNFERSK